MTKPSLETTALKRFCLEDFLDALASNAIIPGAGSASGISLALAAACAGKAVAITLRHDSDNAILAALQAQLSNLSKSALALAHNDALQFKRHLKADTAATAEALLHTDTRLLELCSSLHALLDTKEYLIATNMAGDWQAARALSQASQQIQESIVQELNGQA